MFVNIHLYLSTGSTISRVLGALDALDRHFFDIVDNTNSLDTLYVKIFGQAKKSSTDVSWKLLRFMIGCLLYIWL